MGRSNYALSLLVLTLSCSVLANGQSNSLYQVAQDSIKEKCDELTANGQTNTLAFQLSCSPSPPVPESPPPGTPPSASPPGISAPPDLPPASSPPSISPGSPPSIAPAPAPAFKKPPRDSPAYPPILPVPTPPAPSPGPEASPVVLPAPGSAPLSPPLAPVPQGSPQTPVPAPGPLNEIAPPLASPPSPAAAPPVPTPCTPGTPVVLVNGDFSQNDGSSRNGDTPNGWTVVPAPDGGVDYYFGTPDGVNSAFSFGATRSEDDTISQTISVSPGCRYAVSYYLTNSGTGAIFPAIDSAVLRDSDGNSLEVNSYEPSAPNQGTIAQTHYVGYFTAVRATADLSFAGRNTDDFTDLQDIQITVA